MSPPALCSLPVSHAMLASQDLTTAYIWPSYPELRELDERGALEEGRRRLIEGHGKLKDATPLWQGYLEFKTRKARNSQ
eukprot:scaffold175139_cov16-Tisochrysis_lutea.AAC.2